MSFSIASRTAATADEVDAMGRVAAEAVRRPRRQQGDDPPPEGLGDSPLVVVGGSWTGLRGGPYPGHGPDLLVQRQVPEDSTQLLG